MAGPLEGIRVVELGFWVAGPATSGVLADWGAEVVKIEPPTGDPMRGVLAVAVGIDVPINPAFELDNRGKRSALMFSSQTCAPPRSRPWVSTTRLSRPAMPG